MRNKTSLLFKHLVCSCIMLTSGVSHSFAIECRDSLDLTNVALVNDSLRTPDVKINKEYHFKPTQIILPATLITVGAFGVKNGAFRKLDNSIKDGMADLRGTHYFRADDYIQYLPIIAYVGLGSVGVNSKHSFKERFAVGATAYLAMGIMVNSIKFGVNEKRPDSNALNSFPSGHTATAFMGAELLRLEYGTGIAIGGYTVATAVAFLRLYNNRHWLNDVLAGAGIGILSARIGYWMLPLYQKWFKWSNSKSVAVLPSYDYVGKSFGVGLTACF